MASDSAIRENKSLDPTFRRYDSKQATSYATFRPGYSSSLYDIVLDYHRQYSGSFKALLDVGCGTGSITRALGQNFDKATGVDPGAAMIAQARQSGGHTKGSPGGEMEYEELAAEDLRKMPHSSVDLLTAGMAAHWFHMDQFWHGAAHVVKPGGTVAIWTHSSLYCHPDTANAAEVQRAMSDLEDNILGPFELPSNKLSHDMYDDLLLPWQMSPPVSAFSQDRFTRLEWNRNGSLDGAPDFFGGSVELTLADLAKSLGTSSMVMRWREAHPDLKDTEKDCVHVMTKNIAKILGKEGSDSDIETTKIRVAPATVLLLFTKLEG